MPDGTVPLIYITERGKGMDAKGNAYAKEIMLHWSDELDEEEREKRERLLDKFTELLPTGKLNSADCMAVFEILVKASKRG